MNPGAAVMANVLNPDPESITLNTELETPTLDPATELEQPLSESTSNPETAEEVAAVETPALGADAPAVPEIQAIPVAQVTEEAAQPQAEPASTAPVLETHAAA